MNKKNLELARRAVACDHWRWMVGTPAVAEFHGEKVGLVCIYANHQHMADFYCLDYGEEWENIHVSDQRSMGMLPDLNNPADLGCLLHLVREALDLFGVSTHYVFDPPMMCWQVRNPVEVYAYAATELGIGFTEEQAKKASKLLEIEALITALEDAND